MNLNLSPLINRKGLGVISSKISRVIFQKSYYSATFFRSDRLVISSIYFAKQIGLNHMTSDNGQNLLVKSWLWKQITSMCFRGRISDEKLRVCQFVNPVTPHVSQRNVIPVSCVLIISTTWHNAGIRDSMRRLCRRTWQ